MQTPGLKPDDPLGTRRHEYDIYPPGLGEPYRARRFKASENLYATVGIPREDKMARLRQRAREHGLHTCAQEIWSLVSATVQKRLEVPANLMLFSGMALGYADLSHPINTLRTERAALEDFARMKGFEAL